MKHLKIGNVELENRYILGPMAGVTDLPFRLLCREQGAGLLCMEMVSAKAIYYNNRNTESLLEIHPDEKPVSLQLFGSDPKIMSEMAKRIEERPFAILDINMGCPVPKVVKNGEGSALMKNPKLVYEIVSAVVKAIEKPVTVKIRKGFDDDHVNAVEIARIAEEAGASAVAVHGRTREQYYSGSADRGVIAAVKKAVSIPIIGNGDVTDGKSALSMMEETGCDFVMIGRAALGNPWIFSQLKAAWKGEEFIPPTLEEKKKVMLEQLDMMTELKGEYGAVREMRKFVGWYLKGAPGSAAFRGSVNQITDEKYQTVCVFGGDHVYKMDVRQMLDYHYKKDADITISAIPVDINLAGEYGVIEVDDDWRLTGFIEKPKEKPKSMPNDPTKCLVSMGNYIFKAKSLVEELKEDALDINSDHDFGKNVIPNMLNRGRKVYVYDFSSNKFPGMTPSERGYWRDVGNIDSYFQANMDLLAYDPELNLYSNEWPLRTFNYNFPPAKFIWDEDKRLGVAKNSLVSEGCIISGGSLSNCVLSPKVHINSYCHISHSILLENVSIGRYSKINRAIIDKNVEIPPHTEIDINKEDDLKRGFYVSGGGITVVPKDAIIG